MQNKKRIIVAVTGASGSIYAKRFLEKFTILKDQVDEISLIISDTGKEVWEYEVGSDIPQSDLVKHYSNSSFLLRLPLEAQVTRQWW